MKKIKTYYFFISLLLLYKNILSQQIEPDPYTQTEPDPQYTSMEPDPNVPIEPNPQNTSIEPNQHYTPVEPDPQVTPVESEPVVTPAKPESVVVTPVESEPKVIPVEPESPVKKITQPPEVQKAQEPPVIKVTPPPVKKETIPPVKKAAPVAQTTPKPKVTPKKPVIRCVLDLNCPSESGYCDKDSCVCLKGYKTFIYEDYIDNPMFCNYNQKSKWLAFILEAFLPSIGHLYLGRIIHFIVKLAFLLVALYFRNTDKLLLGVVPFCLLYLFDLLAINFDFYLDGNKIELD